MSQSLTWDCSSPCTAVKKNANKSYTSLYSRRQWTVVIIKLVIRFLFFLSSRFLPPHKTHTQGQNDKIGLIFFSVRGGGHISMVKISRDLSL